MPLNESDLLFFVLVFSVPLLLSRCSKGPGGDGNEPPPATPAAVLDCNNRSISANPVQDSAYSGTVTVVYTGGNGASYPAGAAGLSCVIGKSQKFGVHVGAIMCQTERLSPPYEAGQWYAETVDNIPTYKGMNTGFMVGFSWRL